MAKLGALPEVDIISGFKGVIDYYVRDGVAICRRWPRTPAGHLSPATKTQWSYFAEAVASWNIVDPEVRAAYISMASGSTLTGRDMMIKLYLNGKSILPY